MMETVIGWRQVGTVHTVVELNSEDTCSCRVKTGGDGYTISVYEIEIPYI